MYEAYITTLKEIRKHTNADRLQVTTVFGNNVIVDLSYYEGQRVIYFPVDGQLGKEFAEDNNLVRKKDENGNELLWADIQGLDGVNDGHVYFHGYRGLDGNSPKEYFIAIDVRSENPNDLVLIKDLSFT